MKKIVFIFLFLPLLLFAQSNIERQKEWFQSWLKERNNYVMTFPKIKYKHSNKFEGKFKVKQNVIILYTKKDTSVLVHELTHAYQYQIMHDEDEFLDQVVMPCRFSINRSLMGYWMKPIEIHARIMELRFINNLSPCVPVRNLYFLKIPASLNLLQFFTPEELLSLLNNLY